MKELSVILFIFLSARLFSQGITENNTLNSPKRFIFGIQTGAGWAYEDKAHLYNTSACLTVDYHLKNKLFVQFATQYSWLWKWNEHYLTIPIHFRKQFGNKLSLFAGPAITFDVGYFKDFGISGGAYYHFSKRSAIVLSLFTFNLYDYQIDYFYVPLSLSYRLQF